MSRRESRHRAWQLLAKFESSYPAGMEFGDYVIYVDESGGHNLAKIYREYPIFSLAFCIFRKSDYAQLVAPALQAFKFKWFGHDMVILHEHEIRKQTGPFHILTKLSVREQFMSELNGILEAAPMTIIAAVINKSKHVSQYSSPDNPYELSLVFCIERAYEFLRLRQQHLKRTHVIFEARAGKDKEETGRYGREDEILELEFRRIVQGAHRFQLLAMPGFEIQIVSKKTNSTGLQIADMVARPLGLSVLRPKQENRALEIIKKKIWTGENVKLVQPGMRIFP